MLNKNNNITYQEFINYIYTIKYPHIEIITLSTYSKLKIKDFNNLTVKKY